MKSYIVQQVALLLKLIPIVNDYPSFVLTGGTAINFFFHQKMNRYSVDIDLILNVDILNLKTLSRSEGLEMINENLEKLEHSIRKKIKHSRCSFK